MAKQTFMDQLRQTVNNTEEDHMLKSGSKGEEKEKQEDEFTNKIKFKSPEEEEFEQKKKTQEEFEEEEEETPSNEDEEEEEEESDESEDEEEEEEEGELKLNKQKDKKPQNKKEQWKQLRESKDKWRKKAEELENKVKTLEKSTSEEGSELISLIEEKFGSLGSDTKERVESLISIEEDNKKLKDELDTIKRDIDIKSTDEWKTEYEQPLNDSLNAFYAQVVNTDDDGSIPNEQLFQAFANDLIGQAFKDGDVNATKIKAAVKKFGKFYEEKTGEEYDEPSISDLTKSIRSAINIRSKAESAYKDWEKESENRNKQKQLRNEEENEKLRTIEKKRRRSMASKALNSFELDKLEGLVDEEDVQREFNEVFKDYENQLENPDQAIPFDEFLSIIVKGRLYDTVLKKYHEDIDEKSLKKEVKKGTRGSDRPPAEKPSKKPSKPGERSWLIGDNKKQIGLEVLKG